MKAVYSVLLLLSLTRAATCLFRRKHIHVSQDLRWMDAQAYCTKEHVDLSVINSPQERDMFIADVLEPPYERYWIGLNKDSTEQNFTQWSDGSTLQFMPWSPNEPNHYESEHCVSVNYLWMWYDDNCDKQFNFFCYKWKPQPVVVQEMKTWIEALNHCRTFYTDLISLTTDTDLLMANKTVKVQTPRVWTGLRFLDGSWFWVNGENLGNLTMPSCPVQPYLCGAYETGAGVLENRDCKEKMNFICYK